MKGSGKIGAVLVIGGGVGGMQAALDLGEAGFKVYLMDKMPAIGGVMAMLDKTFPTNDCAMCTIAPRLVGTARHPNVQLLTYTELLSVEGEKGRFEVSIKKKSRYIDETKCTGCGVCAEHCPVEAIDEYNRGLDVRSSVYLSYPQAIPRVLTIDRRKCLGCGICGNVCAADAVSYSLDDEIRDIEVGAIVVSPGLELFDPRTQLEYGYGQYPNVINSLEFERVLSASGPYQGMVLRPWDGKVPERIAFIQCVGSRDTTRDWCSSVCCMYATKHTIIAMEHAPGVKCAVFYMDMRAFGKGFDAYYERAKQAGVRYIRCRPSAVKEVSQTRNLRIQYQLDGRESAIEEFDLVVLSCGLRPSQDLYELAQKLGIELNEFGYCRTTRFAPLESNRKGVLVCGPFVEPKDIPETVTQASGAAAKAMLLLAEVRGSLVTLPVYPPEVDVAEQEPRIGVFICNCGVNIGGVVDVPQVAEYAKRLPNVVHAEHNLFTCSTDTQEKIKRIVKEQNLNRVVVASCTPRTHEPLFQGTIREAGLNPYLFEMANIRDQCSWVHMHEPEAATRKAKDLVRMAVAKSRLLEPLHKRTLEVTPEALVVGGGLAGMTAALQLARQGFQTHLVEKENELGGNLRKLHYLLEEENPQEKLDRIVEEVQKNEKIRLYLGAEITAVEGSVGKFKTTLSLNGSGAQEVEHGITVVATGAQEYTPNEYMYGEDARVVTQLELEENLVHSPAAALKGKAPTVVMIQCVGSREDDRPYCSRVCCAHAVKNALKIKEIKPDSKVYILYRDIRTYGFREVWYGKAREAGVVFVRYDDDRKPEVVKNDGVLKVSLEDPILGQKIIMDCDLLVLSAAVVPSPGNEDLAKKLKVPLTEDKFFLEAHMKLRPVDFATEGVFLCGLAHSPKSVDETISQACGAASRAATILSKESIELEATISQVVDENCDGCAYCIDPCPYGAITLIEYMREGAIKKTVQVDESACKGCGTCQATCPKRGIFVKGFKLDQIRAMVEAAFEEV